MAIERIATDETVFEIADQLTANGEKVTNRAIWTAIGGGSMTTISQSLRHWRERQELQVTQPIERTPLPAALVDVLHQAAAQLWQTAQAETKAELEQLAQATNARIAEAQAERDESLVELQATAEELEQVKAERDTVQAELVSKAESLNTAIIELDAQALAITEANHRADTAEAARTELLARVTQLSELLSQAKTEAKTTAQQLSTARKEAENARVAEQSCQARLEAASREIDSLKAQVKEERAATKQATEQAAELKGRLSVFDEAKQPEPSVPGEALTVPAKTPRKTKKPAGEKTEG
jgi:DNA repair exonuclease SbcCD ATPase subunit